MKKTTSALFSLLFSALLAQAQFIDLVSLGTSGYLIDAGVTTATYTQDVTGTRFSPSVALGDTLGGTFLSGPLNWSSYSDLSSAIYLKISFTGANPLLPISLQVFNSDFSLSNAYAGTTTPIPASASYFKLDLNGPFNAAVLANVGGAQITWNSGATVNANVEMIATVPEPSTYALLSLAGLALGGYAMRRRRRA
jgi:FtsP/CotA-like multicopper oxidase with cupredoxin domain